MGCKVFFSFVFHVLCVCAPKCHVLLNKKRILHRTNPKLELRRFPSFCSELHRGEIEKHIVDTPLIHNFSERVLQLWPLEDTPLRTIKGNSSLQFSLGFFDPVQTSFPPWKFHGHFFVSGLRKPRSPKFGCGKHNPCSWLVHFAKWPANEETRISGNTQKVTLRKPARPMRKQHSPETV